MKVAKGIGVTISLSIWYYLLYQILGRVGATELMWFLYWAYIPAGFLVVWAGEAISNDS